jgi:DNA-binding beta-propeller fold protein YncE
MDTRANQAIIGALLSAVLAVPITAEPAADHPNAQIVIYVEVPPGVADQVTLVPLALALVGANAAPLPLEPVRSEWVSTELAGRQIRLVDQSIESGVYSAIEISFDRIQGYVGRAQIHADPGAEALRVPLDLEIRAGDCAFLILRWVPHPIDEEEGRYQPRLELLVPDVPPLGSLAFVSNEGSGNVSVVDRFTRRIVDVLMVGELPRDLAYSGRKQWLYVALAGSDEIVAIDALSRHIIRRVPLRFGDEPSRILLSEDERTLYVLNQGSDVLVVFAAESLQELSRHPGEEGSRSLDQDRTSGHIYITAEFADEVLVFDPAEGRAIRSITVASSPTEVLVNDRSGELYVSSSSRRRLLIINSRTGALTAQLNLCGPAVGLAYNPVSRRLYAALDNCDEISISRPERTLEISSLRVPGRPGRLSFDSDQRRLLVTLPGLDQLAFYNTNSARLLGLIDVGQRPYAVVVP